MNIKDYPVCPKCEKNLLPAEDTSRQQETAFLKGWFCITCGKSWLFNNGSIIEKVIVKEPGS